MSQQTNILLIEDNPDHADYVRHLISHYPQSESVAMRWKDSLETGLKELLDPEVELVLLDLFLPGSQPENTLEFALQQAGNRPLIVLTSLKESKFAKLALKAGAQDFINKENLTADTLMHSIRYALERNKNLRLLEETQDRFQTIFEVSPIGIALCSPDFKFLNINPAFCRILGHSLENIKKVNLQDLIYPEDAQNLRYYLKQLSNSKDRSIQIEVRFKDIHHKPLWSQLTLKLDRDNLYLVILEDISEKHKLALTRRKQSLQARRESRAKTYFLAQMSHEIRTPLSAIIGYGEILKTESPSPPESSKYLDSIIRNAHYLLELLETLMNLSKMDADQFELEMDTIPLRKEIEDVVSLFKVNDKKIAVDTYFHDESKLPEEIYTDRTRFRQVLINLLGNAVKFTKEGTIQVVVRQKHALLEKDSALEVLIVDSGCGIPASDHSKIFEPFQQGSACKRQSGSGLGLFFSQKIAQKLGGSIRLVESKTQIGSTFAFTLPMSSKS